MIDVGITEILFVKLHYSQDPDNIQSIHILKVCGDKMTPADFYNKLSPFYHLVYSHWEESIARQAADLDSIIKGCFGENVNEILDVSCGIGTQAIGLAELGYNLIGSDVSSEAINRAKIEADNRGLEIDFSVADMRESFSRHQKQFDLVISCDNSVTHLLTDEDISTAFRQLYECTRPSCGCIITVRDYDKEVRSGTQIKPYGIRVENGIHYLVYQMWEFKGETYDVSMYFIEDNGEDVCQTHVMRTKYYAIGIDKLIKLLEKAGFADVTRIDDRFFQPVIVGKKE